MRDKAKMDLNFRQRLLQYMENIASECLPEDIDGDWMDVDDDVPYVDDELQVDNGYIMIPSKYNSG